MGSELSTTFTSVKNVVSSVFLTMNWLIAGLTEPILVAFHISDLQ